MSSYSAPSYCLDCGFGYDWCRKCASCACECYCWDDALWARSRDANRIEYEQYTLWKDEGAQGATGHVIETVQPKGEYL